MPTAEDLDEQTRRRPDWGDGEWITLGDGRRWAIPEVWAEPRTNVGRNGPCPDLDWRIGRPSDPRAVAEFLAELGKMQDADPAVLDRRGVGLAVDFGGVLLRRNYRVDDDEAGYLLFRGFAVRAVEDRAALDEMVACVAAMQRLAIGGPQAILAKLLRSLPPAERWPGGSLYN